MGAIRKARFTRLIDELFTLVEKTNRI